MRNQQFWEGPPPSDRADQLEDDLYATKKQLSAVLKEALDMRKNEKELQAERDRLAALNKELVQFVGECTHAFALQAMRDSSDPKTRDGWLRLETRACFLLGQAEANKP